MRHINEIIVHCSATAPNWASGQSTAWKVQEIRRWHMSVGPGRPKPWSDIGYHYVIDRDGTVMPGRPVERTGAHVAGRNFGTIGVCLIGGHGAAATDDPSDHFTANQMIALRKFIDSTRKDFPSISRVSGHQEYANKACPGFNVSDWYFVQPLADHVPARRPKAGLWEMILAFLRRE